MNDIKIPYSVSEDAKLRSEWICRRTNLTTIEKSYVEFQIKEAVNKAIKLCEIEQQE